jgi:hypothetical protein
MKKGPILVLLVIIVAGTIPVANAQTDGYSRGFSDGACDALGCHGHGFDPSCPGNHSPAYCSNYRSGYYAGWNSVSHIPVLPRAPTSPSSNSSSSNSSGGAIINKFNPNCRSNC